MDAEQGAGEAGVRVGAATRDGSRPDVGRLESHRRRRRVPTWSYAVVAVLAVMGGVSVLTDTNESRPTGADSLPTPTTASSDVQFFDVGPLAPRGGHSVTWTGDEVLVWGGESDEMGATLFSDGAALDPSTGTWRLMSEAPLSPRRYHIAAWTGDEVLIVGGVNERDGAAYDPESDSWRAIAASPVPVGPPEGAGSEGFVGWVWTGERLVVWHVPTDEVAAYSLADDEWVRLGPTGMQVDTGVLRWGGDAVYAFGATIRNYPTDNELSLARLTDSGSWQRLADTDFSSELQVVAAHPVLTAWVDGRFIAWSRAGWIGKTMAYSPREEAWREIQSPPLPACDGQGEPLPIGESVIAFGWCGPYAAVFDADDHAWRRLEVTGSPTARYTVWTGSELINWGDVCCSGTGGEPYEVRAWRLPLR